MSTIILPTSFTTFVRPRQQVNQTPKDHKPEEILSADPGLTDSEQFIATVRKLADLNQNGQLPEDYSLNYSWVPKHRSVSIRFPDGTECRIDLDDYGWMRITESHRLAFFKKPVCALDPNDPLNTSLQEILFQWQLTEAVLV